MVEAGLTDMPDHKAKRARWAWLGLGGQGSVPEGMAEKLAELYDEVRGAAQAADFGEMGDLRRSAEGLAELMSIDPNADDDADGYEPFPSVK